MITFHDPWDKAANLNLCRDFYSFKTNHLFPANFPLSTPIHFIRIVPLNCLRRPFLLYLGLSTPLSLIQYLSYSTTTLRVCRKLHQLLCLI